MSSLKQIDAQRVHDALPDALTPEREESPMRTVGIITTVVLCAVALVAVVVAVVSIPDIKRYLRIRQM